MNTRSVHFDITENQRRLHAAVPRDLDESRGVADQEANSVIERHIVGRHSGHERGALRRHLCSPQSETLRGEFSYLGAPAARNPAIGSRPVIIGCRN